MITQTDALNLKNKCKQVNASIQSCVSGLFGVFFCVCVIHLKDLHHARYANFDSLVKGYPFIPPSPQLNCPIAHIDFSHSYLQPRTLVAFIYIQTTFKAIQT